MLITLIYIEAVVESCGWPVSNAIKLISIVSIFSKSSFSFVNITPEIKIVLNYY